MPEILSSAIDAVKDATNLGGDGGGKRGTATALGTLALSPLVEPAIRQMTTEVAQHWLVGWSPDFQNNAGLLGSMLIVFIGGFALTKIAHLTRGGE